MGIDRAQLILMNAPLVGFRGTRVFPPGAVTLSVMVGDYPQQITRDVTSTYHLMINFLMKYGIAELQKDQVTARECYIAMLEMEDHQQMMCIEEQWTIVEPVEELEEVTLDESRPEQTTRMGTLASQPIRQALAAFLKMNQDVFAWSHEDMLWIDSSIIVHRLNVNPAFSPIQ